MRVHGESRFELEALDTVLPGGSITRNINTTLKESGTLEVVGRLNIGSDLIRIYYVADDGSGEVETPVATMLASTEALTLTSSSATSSVSLYSALLPMERMRFRTSLTIPAGTNILTKAAQLCGACGVPVVMTPLARELTAPMSWDPAATYLEVANDLLALAGYWSVGVDVWGRAVLEPYVDPATRSLAYTFEAGPTSVFLPSVEAVSDEFDVPNVCIVTATRADAEPMVGYYENGDPASPFSTVHRPAHAITESVAEAQSVAELEAIAKRKLLAATSATETFQVDHSFLPLGIGSAVGLRWPAQDLNARGTIQAQELTLGTALMMSSTVKRIWT